MISFAIGNKKNGKSVRVTDRQQLITAPLDYSEAYNATLDVADQGYTLVEPKVNSHFVITDIILTGNKNISNVVDATVSIYEATEKDSATISKLLLQLQVPQSIPIPLIGLNLITFNPSRYINAKTDDDDVDVVLMGYYVEE